VRNYFFHFIIIEQVLRSGYFTMACECIARHPEWTGGNPYVRDIRVTVGMIIGQIWVGRAMEKILKEYPYLGREDIFKP
jgi:uncharacterized protein (DUF433 family)